MFIKGARKEQRIGQGQDGGMGKGKGKREELGRMMVKKGSKQKGEERKYSLIFRLLSIGIMIYDGGLASLHALFCKIRKQD